MGGGIRVSADELLRETGVEVLRDIVGELLREKGVQVLRDIVEDLLREKGVVVLRENDDAVQCVTRGLQPRNVPQARGSQRGKAKTAVT